MIRDVQALESTSFDLIIIGGGIFGACAAWESARRGMAVALIERGDFCVSTSAQSFKLVHGGIRYLQHGDLARVRESSASRRALLTAAPHLVRPLSVVVPTYGHGMRGKGVLRAGMAAYDAATFDRNHGIRDPSRRVSSGRTMTRREVLSLYPGLPTTGLTGAGVIQDGQLLNPPRLVWAFARTAGKLGCAACNYVEATGLVVDGGRAVGVQARDRVGGGDLTIRGRAVLNAAGPYAESFLKSAGLQLEPPTPWSRDAYFVVARALVPGERALALPAKTRDPGALVSRGARHLFLVPWRGRTLVGVWHQVYRGDPDAVALAVDEVEAFLREINQAYNDLDLDLDDVATCNWGLIPFGENDPDAKNLKFSHGSRIVDHLRTDGLAGMFTLIGARFTTAPRDAAVMVDRIVRAQRPGVSVRQGAAATQPLLGGEFPSIPELVAEVRARAPSTLRERDVEALVQNHGSEYPRVLELVRSEPSPAETLGAFPVLKAEVRYAVREEMALTLADVVFRRTELGTGEYPGRRIIDECAEVVAAELGWSQARRSSEVSAVLACYPQWIRDRIDVPESARKSAG